MADEQKTDNSKSQDSGNEGDKGKLFFGKYKTIEDAENGYKELERGFHSKAQEASTYKEIVDKIGTEDRHTTQKTQTHDNSNAAQELTQFYSDPLGWKEKVKREAVAEATTLISGEVRKNQDLASRVTAWSSKNIDVAEHQDLLEVYVKRTDARLSPENRLDLAAGEVRKRLAALRGSKASNSNIDPNTADGEAGSYRQEGNAQHSKESGQAPTGETELASYASSRNKNRMKRPGTHH
jgi:hypothetical protein